MASRDDVRLLSIFHYVLAGLSAFFACVPLIYVAIGAAMLVGSIAESGPHAPPAALGWIFGGLGGVLLLVLAAWVAVLVVAGRSLATQRRWLYCMVVAGLCCASFPFGTVLGVFTLVTLSKPEVKALFGQGQAV